MVKISKEPADSTNEGAWIGRSSPHGYRQDEDSVLTQDLGAQDSGGYLPCRSGVGARLRAGCSEFTEEDCIILGDGD